MTLTVVVHEPADEVRLYSKSQFGSVRTYEPVPYSIMADRLKLAKFSQDFESIKYLLIQTKWESEHGEDRFFPVPLILSNTENLPYFAIDAALRLHDAMRGNQG